MISDLSVATAEGLRPTSKQARESVVDARQQLRKICGRKRAKGDRTIFKIRKTNHNIKRLSHTLKQVISHSLQKLHARQECSSSGAFDPDAYQFIEPYLPRRRHELEVGASQAQLSRNQLLLEDVVLRRLRGRQEDRLAVRQQRAREQRLAIPKA